LQSILNSPFRRLARLAAHVAALPVLAGLVFAGDLNARAAGSICPKGSAPPILGAAPRLPSGRTLRILAIGSSSTEGVGASSKDKAYPARLAVLLAERLQPTEVRNAGIGGEIAAATVRRLETALVDGWPQLVLWQVGTNDAMTKVDPARFRALVVEGVEAARAAKTPILLIDPQYSVLEATQPRQAPYADIVDEVALAEHVPVVRRYAAMRASALAGELPALLSQDGLHMNDVGYECVADALAQFISGAGKTTALNSGAAPN